MTPLPHLRLHLFRLELKIPSQRERCLSCRDPAGGSVGLSMWVRVGAANWRTSGLSGKVPDAGKDWGQKRTSEDEMAGWHHWCNGHELGQTPGDGEGQGGLVCCSPRGRRVRPDRATQQPLGRCLSCKTPAGGSAGLSSWVRGPGEAGRRTANWRTILYCFPQVVLQAVSLPHSSQTRLLNLHLLIWCCPLPQIWSSWLGCPRNSRSPRSLIW